MSEPFGEVLRRFRVAAGLSQEGLADRAGLSAHGISDLERGARTRPYPGTLQRLAEALELTEAERAVLNAAARPDRSNFDEIAAAAFFARKLVEPVGALEGTLVGREHEIQRLTEECHAARNGMPRAVLVIGEAGIGKTRLVTEFLGLAAAQGADVLAGRAFEAGGRLPYQPLVDALRLRLERENVHDQLLSNVWLAELARLLPELADRYPDLPVPVGDEAVARVRLFETVVRLVQALAARAAGPVVLFLDDIQWADTATLDVLHYMAGRFVELGLNVLLLLNVRVEALADDPELAEWLVGVERELPVSRIALAALDPDNTEALVRSLGIAPEPPGASVDAARSGQSSLVAAFARWLFDETHGQPFFVSETLKALLERGALVSRPADSGRSTLHLQPGVLEGATRQGFLAPGVREVLRARLARLSSASSTLLTAAAVVGQGCSFEQLARVAALSEQDALPALDQALRAWLLHEADGRYYFGHDKIREVAYAEAGEARRRAFHRRALETLEQDGAAAAELAHHALAAGLDDRAFELSIAAGDAAMRLLAAQEAVEHYGRARAIAERRSWTGQLVDLHVRFGKAYVSLAQWTDARRELEAALALNSADQPTRAAEVLMQLLEVCWWSLDLPALRSRAADLRNVGERLERADLQAIALSWLAPTVAADGDPGGCITLGEQAVARAHALGFAPPPMVHTYLSSPYYWLGRLDEAIDRGRESLAAAREANHTSAAVFALPNVGMALAASGRYDEAQRMFEEARRFGREYAVGTLLARAIAISAGYHLDVFDFVGNETLAEEARELARSLNFTPPIISAGLDLILNFARRHDVGRAESMIPEVAAASEKATAWHGWLWALRLAEARAELALARGDWEDALTWATRNIEQSHMRGRVKYEALGLTTRSRALAALGRRADALADAERAAGLAREMGDPALFLGTASALLTLGENERVAVEARATVERIVRALPNEALRNSFEAAEPVRLVLKGP